MKRIAFLLTAILLFFLSGCGKEPEDAAVQYHTTSYTSEYLIDGVVASTSFYQNFYNDAGIHTHTVHYEDGIEIDTSHYEYEEYGNPVKIVTVSEDGEKTTDFVYTLDDQQRILRKEEYTNGLLFLIEEISYDKSGNKLSHTLSTGYGEADKRVSVTEYTYNWRGDLVQTKTTDRDTGCYGITDYEDGKQIQYTSYDASGKRTDYETRFYDSDGFFCKWIRYNSDDTIHHSCDRIWDETGMILTELHYNPDGTLTNHKDVFTYDEHGNQLMQERYKDGEVYWRISHTYEPIPETE